MKAKYIEDYAASGVEPFRVEGCEFGQLYFSTFFDKDDALIFERHDIDGTTMFELKYSTWHRNNFKLCLTTAKAVVTWSNPNS
jgi:hypothetical protein